MLLSLDKLTDFDRISSEDFKKAIYSQDPRTVFSGTTVASAIMDAQRITSETFHVDLKFDFNVRIGNVRSRHTVYRRLGHSVTREVVEKIQRIVDSASDYDLMFAALSDGWIDIQEVFGAVSDDPEEGSGNWFWRHGIPTNAEILCIYPPDVTARQLS